MRISLIWTLSVLTLSVWALPLEEIDHFSLVYQTIKEIYVDEIDEKTLMNYAIEGLIQKLDPHSDYLSGAAAILFEQSTEGQFGGLGFELSPSPSGIEIMSVCADSPASQAELHSHDIILMIDGILTQGMPLREASTKIRGPIGSSITLTILPTGSSKPIEKKIERALIKNPSVVSKTLENRWGYIRINMFSQETTTDFLHALKEEIDSHNVEGIILDLRNNPGGLLQSGVAVSNAFLDANRLPHDLNSKPLIVSARGRHPGMFIQEHATGDDLTHGLPVVVLINQGSASASEIVAGALQDYGRAVIVGERSFGKGSVQTMIPIENNLLKMTCSRYYTPSGRSIQASGIEPDIIVQGLWVPKEDPSISISEQNLNRHLVGGEQKAEILSKSEIIHDSILEEGIRILKALAIQKHS